MRGADGKPEAFRNVSGKAASFSEGAAKQEGPFDW